jgi:PKD repeat protein
LCSGDSISFSDQSINAAPGWQWYFPGGSPASSTAQNPRVLYTAEGTYQASLIVSNANGTDTITQNVNVDFADNQIRVNIIFDSYPTETSWQITDSTGAVMASGGPYSQGNNSINELVCIPDGCYTFTVFDSYGDGLCCGYGNGSYNLIDTGNVVVGSGGQFNSQESVNFCFNASPPINIDQVNTVTSGCGLDNGSLTVLASGGNGNYQYSVDGINYQTNNVFNQLAPGTYLVYASDNSSIDSTFATILEIPGPTAIASSSNPNVLLNNGGNVNFSGILSTNVDSYSWDFGDGSTANTMTTSHAFTAVGTYTVVLTVRKDSCFNSDTIIVNVSTASSTNVASNEVFGLELRPNPVQDQFEVEIQLPEPSNDVEIFIHNALGQMVYWEKVDSYSSTIKRKLNFSNESDGFYFLSVQNKKQRQFLKFVKGS